MTKKTIYAILILGMALLLTACGGGEAVVDSGDVALRVLEDGTYAVTGYTGTDTELVLDAFGDAVVSRIDDSAFAGNETLTAVTLGAGVREIGVAAFADCTALTRVDAGASALTRIGNAAFLGCDALVEISLPTTLTNVGVDAFLTCDAITTVNYEGQWGAVLVGANNEAISDKLGGSTSAPVDLLAKGSCSAAVSWTLDKSGTLTVSGEGRIPDYTFDTLPWMAHIAGVRRIVIEDGIDIIGKNAFNGFSKLETVELADSVRLIEDSAFYGCEKLSDVTLPARLRRIGSGAFYGCESLTALTIPDSVTHIGGGAFMNCRKLTSVTLSSALTTIEQWTFSGCVQLTSVVVPEGVTDIGVGAFNSCAKMTDITLGGEALTVGKNAFRICSSLKTVHFRGDIAKWETQVTVGENNNALTSAEWRGAQ